MRVARAVTFIGLIGMLVLAGCATSTSPSPSTAPTSSIPPSSRLPASVTPSGLPSIPVSDRFAVWKRFEMPDPTPQVYGGEWAADVIAYKTGYRAIGFINGGCCDGGFTTDTRAVMWTSLDGKTWRLEPDLPEFALSHMVGAATDGYRIVVVGSNNVESVAYPGSAESRGAVWTSTDGASWKAQFENVPQFNSVTFSYGRFWAAANRDAGPEIWSTTDGLSWTLEASPSVLGAGSINVLRSTSLGLIAAGFAEVAPGSDGSRTSTAMTWLSTGSGVWHRAPDQPALLRAQMEDVAGLDGKLLALGANEAADGGLVWESEDGLVWTRVDQPAFALDCALPDKLIATPAGLLAAGAKGCSTAQFRAWTSPDGSMWSMVPDSQPGLKGQELQVQGWLIRADGSVLAVGYGSVSDVFHVAPMAWLVEP
jgi:hypothetical protein